MIMIALITIIIMSSIIAHNKIYIIITLDNQANNQGDSISKNQSTAVCNKSAIHCYLCDLSRGTR